MSEKISFEALNYQVELLYQKDMVVSDCVIHERCQEISAFILACGWSEDDYWQRWIDDNSNLEDLLDEDKTNKQLN